MGKEIAFLYSNNKREQMESLIDISQTPPMHTTSWMLEVYRVGEMVDQTAGVVRATQLGLLKYKPVLLLSDKKNFPTRLSGLIWQMRLRLFQTQTTPRHINLKR